MIAAEARRRRLALISKVAALRANTDKAFGEILQELHTVEALEREADRAMRECEPEWHVQEPTR